MLQISWDTGNQTWAPGCKACALILLGISLAPDLSLTLLNLLLLFDLPTHKDTKRLRDPDLYLPPRDSLYPLASIASTPQSITGPPCPCSTAMARLIHPQTRSVLYRCPSLSGPEHPILVRGLSSLGLQGSLSTPGIQPKLQACSLQLTQFLPCLPT